MTSNAPLPHDKVPRQFILQSPKGLVDIPLPSETDLEFARSNGSQKVSLGRLDEFCRNGNLWGVQYAINSGTDINNHNGDPLNFAAEHERSMVVALLLENGASTDAAYKNEKCDDSVKKLINGISQKKEQKWIPTSDDTIMHRRSFFDNAQSFYVVRSEFNFRSRKITTYTEKNGQDLNLVIERFSEQDTLDEIVAAHTELSRQRGTVSPIENYVDGVVDKRPDAIKRVSVKRSKVL